jgi:uncharacterized protein
MENNLLSVFKFKVQDSPPIGKGCFATSPIVENEIICKFSGPKMQLKDFFEKYDFQNGNPLQISEDQYLDLISPYVFFNHSCNPNAGLRNNGVLFALKNINSGEQITYDYSTTIDDVTWKMDCLCKSDNCRGVIRDFLSIPHEQKQYYFRKSAILKFLRELYF